MNEPSTSHGSTWLAYTMLTVFTWGVYGILLHKGQVLMQDNVNGRYKAFLFVGIAYFLTAVLAPLLLLMTRGAAFSGYTSGGALWSLIAGIAGAIGAFGVLLAFGASGKPPEVMAIVFAGAPVLNAIVSLAMMKNINWAKVNPLFYLGIVMALAGGGMVTLFKPGPPPPAKTAAAPSDAPPVKSGDK